MQVPHANLRRCHRRASAAPTLAKGNKRRRSLHRPVHDRPVRASILAFMQQTMPETGWRREGLNASLPAKHPQGTSWCQSLEGSVELCVSYETATDDRTRNINPMHIGEYFCI